MTVILLRYKVSIVAALVFGLMLILLPWKPQALYLVSSLSCILLGALLTVIWPKAIVARICVGFLYVASILIAFLAPSYHPFMVASAVFGLWGVVIGLRPSGASNLKSSK